MKDSEHPFFRPLWRRIALVVFCVGLGGVRILERAGRSGATLALRHGRLRRLGVPLNYSLQGSAADAEKPAEPEADKE